MKIEVGKYYRTRRGLIVGPLRRVSWCDRTFAASDITWKENGSYVQGITNPLDLISLVYVSDTLPINDFMLNLSEIARTKSKAMGEGNFGMDENPPCGIRLRWLVEVVDRPRDTLLNVAAPPADERDALRAENARLLKIIDAIVDEYDGQMHGPILHTINEARTALGETQ